MPVPAPVTMAIFEAVIETDPAKVSDGDSRAPACHGRRDATARSEG
jgi:hypothetical protein